MPRLHAALLLRPARSASARDAIGRDGTQADRPPMVKSSDGPPGSVGPGDVPADLPTPNAAAS
jgi:hypothetical protein